MYHLRKKQVSKLSLEEPFVDFSLQAKILSYYPKITNCVTRHMSRSVVYSVNWAVDVTFETEWIDGKKEELTQSSLMSHENYA